MRKNAAPRLMRPLVSGRRRTGRFCTCGLVFAAGVNSAGFVPRRSRFSRDFPVNGRGRRAQNSSVLRGRIEFARQRAKAQKGIATTKAQRTRRDLPLQPKQFTGGSRGSRENGRACWLPPPALGCLCLLLFEDLRTQQELLSFVVQRLELRSEHDRYESTVFDWIHRIDGMIAR